MAERLGSTSPLPPLAAPAAGVAIAPVESVQVTSLAARAGHTAELAAAVQRIWSVVLPSTPLRVEGGGLAFVWAGLDRWLVTAPAGPDLEAALVRDLGAFAAVTDQSGGRTLLRLRGPGARATLVRLVGIDLHPRRFRTGDTALTLAGHVPVQIWQLDDTPAYDIAVPRSLAESLAHELQAVAS